MAATIKIKNSSTAGAAPTASDLVQGELAVNVTDKRLYTENSGGTIVELGTNPSVPVTFPDGSASAPSLTNSGDTNTGMFFPAADTIAFAEGGTESMRLDSSGNLGLGITPSAWGTTTLKAIQMGGGALALSSGGAGAGDGSLTWNGYYNGTNWIYVYTGGAASRFRLNESGAAWFTSASGTAGNAITFTQAMTLDASGNLALGKTSASYRFDLQGASGENATLAGFFSGTNTSRGLTLGLSAGGGAVNDAYVVYNSTVTGGYAGHIWQAGGTESARIDSSGNLLVGTTTAFNANDNGFNLLPGTGTALVTKHINGTASGSYYALYTYNGTYIGSITQNGTTGVLYNLTSDYRLKNDQQPLTGSKEFVMALQPKKWQWWDGSGEGVGFIAHEFMEVAKYSGNGEKDAVDENGNPVYQSIQPSSSEVMANLVAFIQEQQAIITQLQADVAALKGQA